VLGQANRRAKGKRPWFFNDPDVERVLNITMVLAMEHAVTRQRLDALERLIEAKGLLTRSELDAFTPDADAEAERTRWMKTYIARVLRIVAQSSEAASDAERAAEPAMDDLINQLRGESPT
jgi:hypothetical protein